MKKAFFVKKLLSQVCTLGALFSKVLFTQDDYMLMDALSAVTITQCLLINLLLFLTSR